MVIIVAFTAYKLSPAGFFQKSEPPPIPAKTPAPKAAPLELSDIFKQVEKLLPQNNFDEAIKLYRSALEKNQNNYRIHNDLGYLYLEKNLLPEAEKQLILALEIEPSCSECHNDLGLVKTRQKKMLEAEQAFNKTIVYNADFPHPYFNLGVLYEKNGDTGNAVVAYQDFLKHSPKKNSILYVQVENRILTLTGK